MAQHNTEHLTMAELSAYLDEELTSEERALCDAHIQSCQPCQAALADLRLTSELLSSLPQVAVPRSFALPTNLALLPETPALAANKTFTQPIRPVSRIWRRSLSVASSLVAVLGLLIFLVGASTFLGHPGASNSASSSAGISVAHPVAAEATLTAAVITGTAQQALSPSAHATRGAASVLTPTPISPQPTDSGTSSSQAQPSTPSPGLPPALDLAQPQGRLSIGAALLLLGVLGALLTRLPGKTRR